MSTRKRFLVSVNWGRWCGVALLGVAVTMLCAAYYWLEVVPRVYLGLALIDVQPRGPAEALGLAADPIEEEIGVMRSPAVLQPIIQEQNLDRQWAKLIDRAGLQALPMEVALGFLNMHLKLGRVPRTNVIRIQFASRSPREAAAVVNALVDRYKVARDVGQDQRIVREENALRIQIRTQEGVVASTSADDKKPLAQQAILNALNERLNRVLYDHDVEKSQVRIISLAAVPRETSVAADLQDFLQPLPEGVWVGTALATLFELILWLARGSTRDLPRP